MESIASEVAGNTTMSHIASVEKLPITMTRMPPRKAERQGRTRESLFATAASRPAPGDYVVDERGCGQEGKGVNES